MSFHPRLATETNAAPSAGFETVAIVGLGYIGLPTAAVMASRGVNVVGIDINKRVVDTINRGEIHIVEPLLDQTVKGAVEAGRLRAVTAAAPADAFLIAVPTPINTDKRADLSYVMSATDLIAPVLKRGDLVILESTSPVGTTEKVAARLAEQRPDLRIPTRGSAEAPVDVNVAYCPERVLPGKVVEELVANDRAIGGLTTACTERAIKFYRLFVHGELVATDARSAELCKLAENACRDVNIAFANELANVCETMSMDVWEVIRLANRHPRINILKPGAGVGGHCIAVDPWFIVEAAPRDTPVLQAARHVNDGRPERAFKKIQALATEWIASNQRQPRLALLGIAFKPNIDDIRESPAVDIVRMVAQAQLGQVLVVEPHISALPASLADLGAELVGLDKARAAADIVVLLVDHDAFKGVSHSEGATQVVHAICRPL